MSSSSGLSCRLSASGGAPTVTIASTSACRLSSGRNLVSVTSSAGRLQAATHLAAASISALSCGVGARMPVSPSAM